MTKKINIKTKKNKKSQSKRFQRKRSQRQRSQRQKSINRFNGGAFQSPLMQAPVQGKNKCALFFDNETKNFERLYIKCPNVINIKVADNINNVFEYNDILPAVNVILPQDPLDPTKYTKFISSDPNKLIYFDRMSGIPTDNLNRLSNFFNVNSNSDFITDIILDFDRTFTMCEGLFATNYLSGQLKYLDPSYTGTSIDANIIPQDSDPETMNLLTLIMGGLERIQAMKNLLELWLSKNIMITILTNNTSPLKTPHLIPDIIRLVLERPNLDGLNIQIFSTHQTLAKNPPANLRKQFKYETLNDKGICNNFDAHINAIKQDLKTILTPELKIIP